MKVTLLTFGDIQDDIKDEIQKMIPTEEERYEKEIQRIIGNNTSEEEEEEDGIRTVYIDPTKYYKEVEFFFRIENVKGMYLSPLKWQENPIMVILLNDKEYNCKFDKDNYIKLSEHLNNY